MGSIIIGKHALESLTTGMYTDPLVVFREYIQNSSDSIDMAVENAILKAEDSRIDIQVLPVDKIITISDNGMGISVDEAEKTLISVGNSKKTQGASRGFRGIGRLAALSYCGSLVFETSFKGEKTGTRLTIDARKLSLRLSQDEKEDVSAEEVLEGVYSVEQYAEIEGRHYFNVIMHGVEADSELLNRELVQDYLTQNIPVGYDSEHFVWGKEIKHRIKNMGYVIPEYNVYFNYAGDVCRVLKPYTDSFNIDKNGNTVDKIKDIQVISFRGVDDKISAYGWLATTSYLGSLYDKSIKGLRTRKGNILIGDGQTLNVCFKDARFNGWVIGEIFVVDPQLIPNARRDNFEKNAAYFLFTEQIKNVAATIIRDIRAASISRNSELARVINKQEEVKGTVEEALSAEELNPGKKAVLKKRLSDTRNALDQFSSTEDVDLYNKEIAFDEIDMLIGKLQGATAYKALNALQNVSKVEKKTLEKVFDTVVSVKPDDAEEIIDSILKVFASL